MYEGPLQTYLSSPIQAILAIDIRFEHDDSEGLHERAQPMSFDRPKACILKRHPSLMLLCADFFEPRGSRLGPLKSTFSAGNFIHRLSWSISVAISAQFTFKDVSRSQKSPKKTILKPYFSVEGHCCRCQSKARVRHPISD